MGEVANRESDRTRGNSFPGKSQKSLCDGMMNPEVMMHIDHSQVSHIFDAATYLKFSLRNYEPRARGFANPKSFRCSLPWRPVISDLSFLGSRLVEHWS